VAERAVLEICATDGLHPYISRGIDTLEEHLKGDNK